jgi:hypothetical protein
MSRPVVLVIAIGALLVSPGVQAADLVIGGVPLHLGMPQDQVLAALSKEFDAKQVSVAEGKYILWFRPPNPLGRSAGSVSFKDGKLYRASKEWGETPTPVGGRTDTDGLFAVLAEIAGRGGRIGRVRAETLRAPGSPGITGSEVRLLTLELPPDRKILLQITEPLPGSGAVSFQKSATVEELLVELPVAK